MMPKVQHFVSARIRLCAFLTFACITLQPAASQTPFIRETQKTQRQNIFDFEKTPSKKLLKLQETSASNWFDVTYYGLNLNITADPNFLSGEVTIGGVCREDNQQFLIFDLMNTMHIDSVRVNGLHCSVTQAPAFFTIVLDRFYMTGENLSVEVFYEGSPVATGLGSFVFNSHSGTPWICSLSEPYGASDWWPCKNTPGDKADSADIIVTCDSTFKVGSEGTLVSAVNQGNGKTIFHWHEHYPIASYLISVSMTNYVQFSNWFRYSATDSMEVLNYILPEDLADAMQTLPQVTSMLSIYSNLFGIYPFIKEKYGHAEFESGGMEHQTMTSLGTFDENVIAHELAHQWFGDMITCRSWSDLWLNEGFAVYCTALYREKEYGFDSYAQFINAQLNSAVSADGETGAPDTSTAINLFNNSLVYAKGACILHMLRHALGDSVFFRCMYAYANDPSLKYSTASTHDLQTVFEHTSGINLGYFFQEWVYGEGFPDYIYSWDWSSTGGTSQIILNIEQTPDRTNPAFFTMPIDIRISAPGRSDTTVSVFNNQRSQSFTVKFPVHPVSITLDPDQWILKRVYSQSQLFPTDFLLEQNYPNPFNSTTHITYLLARSEQVTLKIYDVLGRGVVTLVNAKQGPGTYEYEWNPTTAASGVFFYTLIAGNVRLQKKMMLLR